MGLFDDGVLTGPAQVADLPPPTLTVACDTTDRGRRLLTVTVTPQRAVRLIYLDLPDATVVRATVGGREVPPEELAGRFGVVFHAPPIDGVTVDQELQSPSPTPIRVLDGSDGLGDLPGFVPRPDGVGIRGSHTSELVVVAKTYTV